MALTKRQRKERLRAQLGKGAQRQVADTLQLSETVISHVMNDKTQTLARETVKLVREAIAEKIGEPVQEVFGNAA